MAFVQWPAAMRVGKRGLTVAAIAALAAAVPCIEPATQAVGAPETYRLAIVQGGFSTVGGIAIGSDGTRYVLDGGDGTVTAIAPNGTLTQLADANTVIPATNATAASTLHAAMPLGIAVDADDDVYVAIPGTNAGTGLIVKIAGGIATVVAGGGSTTPTTTPATATTLELNGPRGLAIDADGNLYIADTDDAVVTELDTSGEMSVIAGGGATALAGGASASTNIPATDAVLSSPMSLAVDADGDLYIADEFGGLVEKVSGSSLSVIAGGGATALLGSDTATTGIMATDAALAWPDGIGVDDSGDVYVADDLNELIVKIDQTTGTLDVVTGLTSGQIGLRTTTIGTAIIRPRNYRNLSYD